MNWKALLVIYVLGCAAAATVIDEERNAGHPSDIPWWCVFGWPIALLALIGMILSRSARRLK